MRSVTSNQFPIKKLLIKFLLISHVESSYLNKIQVSLNHCKKMKAEPSRLIPQKLTNLELNVVENEKLEKYQGTDMTKAFLA